MPRTTYELPHPKAPKHYPGLLLVLVLTGVSCFLWGTQVPDLRQAAEDRHGRLARETVERWEAMISANGNVAQFEQVEAVNDFFNDNIRWKSDYQIYQQQDYWASPLETMSKGVGDCEDFAIAKYATLALLGVPPDSLRLVYVKARYRGQDIAHMVLAWYPNPQDVPLILDNLDRGLKPADKRTDLKAVFSFNADDLWLGAGENVTGQRPTARLSRWNEVVLRIREEGFNKGF